MSGCLLLCKRKAHPLHRAALQLLGRAAAPAIIRPVLLISLTTASDVLKEAAVQLKGGILDLFGVGVDPCGLEHGSAVVCSSRQDG